MLTLQETADELGVHYMTAYRYVRLGLMAAEKRGGKWSVSQAAVDAFRDGSTTAPVKAGERAPWASRLEARLVAGDGRGAWGVVESAMAAGAAVDEIYLDVMSPAMASIGERWSSGEISVAIEHRASGMALRIIGQIGPRFTRRGRRRGTIVTATPIGEVHTMPVAMLSDLLRLEGWEVSDLGADLPTAALVGLLLDTPGLVAVGLSATSEVNLGKLAESCESVRCALPDLLIVVGGQAVRSNEHASSLGADAYGASAMEMSRIVELHVSSAMAPSTS